MHELSLADSIVHIASAHARGRRVTRVELKLGHLRQAVPSALTFAFALVAAGTPVEGAELAIEEIPAVGRCERCGSEGGLPGFPLACAACGSLDIEIVSGEELLVDALELEETMATIGGEVDGD
jgi:hydrogenase nickel incorporation protein HypA/HybF